MHQRCCSQVGWRLLRALFRYQRHACGRWADWQRRAEGTKMEAVMIRLTKCWEYMSCSRCAKLQRQVEEMDGNAETVQEEETTLDLFFDHSSRRAMGAAARRLQRRDPEGFAQEMSLPGRPIILKPQANEFFLGGWCFRDTHWQAAWGELQDLQEILFTG